MEGTTVKLDGGSSNETEDSRSKDSEGSNADHDYQKGRKRSTEEMNARNRLAVVGRGVLGVGEKSGFTSSLGGE